MISSMFTLITMLWIFCIGTLIHSHLREQTKCLRGIKKLIAEGKGVYVGPDSSKKQ